MSVRPEDLVKKAAEAARRIADAQDLARKAAAEITRAQPPGPPSPPPPSTSAATAARERSGESGKPEPSSPTSPPSP